MSGTEIAVIISPILTAVVAIIPNLITWVDNRNKAKIKLKEYEFGYFEKHEQTILNELVVAFGEYSQNQNIVTKSNFIAALSKSLTMETMFSPICVNDTIKAVMDNDVDKAIENYFLILKRVSNSYKSQQATLFSSKSRKK